jgi:hypothetical protein
MHMNRQSGKVHWMILVGGVGFAAILGLSFLGLDSPTGAAGKFMGALATGDYKTVASVSHVEPRPGESPEDAKKRIEEEWKFATEVAGKHYRFRYRILGQVMEGENAAINMQVWKNYSPSAYEENFDLPMVKSDGKWKVAVRGMSRKWYPGVPR